MASRIQPPSLSRWGPHCTVHRFCLSAITLNNTPPPLLPWPRAGKTHFLKTNDIPRLLAWRAASRWKRRQTNRRNMKTMKNDSSNNRASFLSASLPRTPPSQRPGRGLLAAPRPGPEPPGHEEGVTREASSPALSQVATLPPWRAFSVLHGKSILSTSSS